MYIIVVQSVNHVQLFATPWTAVHHPSLSSTISWSLLKFMFIESVMLTNHLILCHPFLLLPSIFSSIRVFFNELTLCIRWPKYWSFSPSNEYSGLISFRIDWFDLLAILSRVFSSTIQNHNFLALSLSYGPTLTFVHDSWKNNSFDQTDFVGK